MKTCSCCGIEKLLNEFHNCKSKSDGKFSACKECRNRKSRERAQKIGHDVLYQRAKQKDPEGYRQRRHQTYLRNKSKNLERVREYRVNNPEKKRRQRKEDYQKNKHRYIARADEWKQCNPEKRKQIARDHAKKIYNDEGYKPVIIARKLMSRVFEKLGTNKEHETFCLLGYSVDDLREHIERQFRPGMSWANHGEWHVDHVVPISRMVKNGITDPARINALSNLQPLWASENFSKRDKLAEECDASG